MAMRVFGRYMFKCAECEVICLFKKEGKFCSKRCKSKFRGHLKSKRSIR